MKDFVRDFRRNPKATGGLIIVGLVFLMALLAPAISPYDPLAVDPVNSYNPPSWNHPFGTDFYGRDILSRIIWGARPSLIIGLASVGLGCLVGTLVGFVAGYFGRWVDGLLMRLMDILLSFPIIVLALAIVAALGRSLPNLIVTISILFIPRYSRILRGEAMNIKEQDFVEAARASGATDMAILRRHILPNALAQIIVTSTVFMASAILIESGLSFLGVGVVPPNPSWGNMLADGRTNILGAPWLTTFPGLMLMVTLTGFNLLGDALRDILDPRVRQTYSG
ncbi:MAG: ABC transporter permease [Deltaproteobacteria bacterium]|nr:ABC transporter permease [Deltaproteobacteria bacterium]MBW2120421.1 ABC transporter permease [Deltaproteobacteria bacterium]